MLQNACFVPLIAAVDSLIVAVESPDKRGEHRLEAAWENSSPELNLSPVDPPCVCVCVSEYDTLECRGIYLI